MRRPPRGLTAAEETLWSEVTRRVARAKPLPVAAPDAPSEPGKPAVPPIPKPQRKVATAPAAKPPKRSPIKQPQPTFTDLPTDTSPAMDKRSFQRLTRGKMDIDATLDLHGMTADQARQRLIGFVTQAHYAGFRLLLIITGKGRTDGGRVDEFNRPRRAVIRESLPGWLSGPRLSQKVLQVTQAHPKHGGAGAFYVYLRRQR